MTRSQNHRNRAGFTLIELLVAMAIMSAILAAIYNTFLLTQRALSTVDQSTVKLQEARAFMDILTREIESALYSPDNVYCLFKIDDRDFYGRQASALTLSTFSPMFKGLARINCTVEEKDGILVVTKSMNSAFSKAGADNRIDLLEDIESFEVQAKDGSQWVKTWDSALTGNVPEAVRITLKVRIKKSGEEALSSTPFSLSETVRLKVGSPL